MTNRTVIIFGATSEGGVELARLLNDDGYNVICMVREVSDTKPLENLGVEMRSADARCADQVAAALEGVGADSIFVSFIGGRDDSDRLDDSIGNINAIDTAKTERASRFILITSVGCGGTMDVISKDVRPEYTYILGEKDKAEKYLRDCGLPWTILRPGGLSVPKPMGHPILVEDQMVMGNIHRLDLARIVHDVIKSEATIGKIYTTIDANDCHHIKGGEIVPITI